MNKPSEQQEQRFNVVEVLAPHPRAGRIVVVPVKGPVRVRFSRGLGGRPLQLRNARYRLCNVSFDFADGFACGLITGRRAG